MSMAALRRLLLLAYTGVVFAFIFLLTVAPSFLTPLLTGHGITTRAYDNVLDSTELPAGTDLRRSFADGLASLEREGWQSEGASGAMVFVRRGAIAVRGNHERWMLTDTMRLLSQWLNPFTPEFLRTRL